MSPGAVWLVPTPLGAGPLDAVLPQGVLERARSLSYFIAEEPKTARAFLKSIGHPSPMASLTIERLDGRTTDEDAARLLERVRGGQDAGLLSEAGCPALADPGSLLVRLAHREGIRVVPLAGPSSVVLALMASGLETQRFCFHGYLPIREPARGNAIQALERRSHQARETQIFIEAPYRNDALMKALLATCKPETWLCVASDLTTAAESVATRAVYDWRRAVPSLDRRPTVFLVLAH